MNNAKNSLSKRIVAVFLSALMLFSVVPVNSFAAYATEEDVTDAYFAVIVTDGENPVEGAAVTVKSEDKSISEKVITDEDGIAAFVSIAELEKKYEGDENDFICSYTVVADGYEIISGKFCPADEGGWTGKTEVVLTKIIPEISEKDYTVNIYNGVYDGEEHDAVTVKADGYTVEYKTEGKDYSSDVPTVKNSGKLPVEIKISKDGYKDKIIEVVANVQKAIRDDFSFGTASPDNITYNPSDTTYKNTASSKLESSEIVYAITEGKDFATIDTKSGELTFSKVGNVKVSATMAESENYKESVAEYSITMVPADRDFGFTKDNPQITYDPDNNLFENVIENKENVGTIVYSIFSQERDGKEVDDVADIDPATGKLKILSSGTVVVEAAVSAAGNYASDTATYTLTVTKAKQELYFSGAASSEIEYNSTFKNALFGGKGEGKITYEVTNEKLVAGDNVVTVDEKGNVTAVGIGTATVKAIKAADDRYEEANASYKVTVVKAKQKDFTLGEDKTVFYGTKEESFETEGNISEGEITYSVEVPENAEECASVDAETGLITFIDKKTGAFTLKAVSAGNEFYEKAEATCKVSVEAKDMFVHKTVSGTKVNGWYITDYVINASEGYKIGYNNSFADDVEWSDKLVISNEGTNNVFAYCLKEEATGYISEYIENDYVSIDKTNPTIDIEYSEAVTIFEKIKRFYKDSVEVTLRSFDEHSGVESFVYSIDGTEAVTVEKKDIKNGDTEGSYYYTFSIPAQYNGKVSANAIDGADRAASEDELVADRNGIELVVDNIAPNVTVQFRDKTSFAKNNYFDAARKAYITVVEKNFYEEDIDILYQMLDVKTNKYVDVAEKIEFKAVEGKKDTYEAIVEFDEDGAYKFDIKYTDKSGNVYDEYPEQNFVVDTTAPVVEIKYINKSKTGYNKETINATVVVNERYFDPESVEFNVSALYTDVDGTIKNAGIPDYAEMLREADWYSNGDTYITQISFDAENEARYNLSLSYRDYAGNAAVSFKDSFVIDKTAPASLDIKYSKPEGVFEELMYFFKDTVKVKISAYDAVAGVGSIVYSCDLEDGVSGVNKGIEETEVKFDGDVCGTAAVEFEIPAQYRGKIKFTATDRAEIASAEKLDKNIVIVDNIVPGVDVKFDNNDVRNGKYYNADRKATINIDEANFWESDVKTTVNGEETKLVFASVKDDLYSAGYEFTEDGKYAFEMNYSDRSNNKAERVWEEFIIDKTAPVAHITYDNNTFATENYLKGDRLVTLTVNERNFDPSLVKFVISGVNAKDESVISSDAYADFVKNPDNWTHNGDVHTLTFSNELMLHDGKYTITFNVTDLAGNSLASEIEESFIIDDTLPTNLTIDYREAVTVKEKLFSFFKDEVFVTISAQDETSGIKEFKYSYPLDEGVSSSNNGESNSITVSFDEPAYSASHTFRIPAQYRGKISFDAYDYATNVNSQQGEETIVVDNIAPGVSVVFDNNNVLNEKYYDDVRSAVITVNEANFWPEDVKITVERRLNNEDDYTTLDQKYEFKPVEDKEDTYQLVIDFKEDGDYRFDITYTDRSGNVYDSFDAVEFTVDTIDPVIEFTYDEACEPVNENNHNHNRAPELTITEHNFDPKDIDFSITGMVTGIENSIIDQNYYVSYLMDTDNWSHNGDVHTITFDGEYELNVDARYHLELSYSDLAGNESNEIKEDFVIDKEAPAEESLEIYYHEGTWFDNLMEALTLGFYKTPARVTLKAVDNVSGIDYYTYSYTVCQNVLADNAGEINVEGKADADGNFTFEIPAQFRGYITFSVTDKANNTSKTAFDDKIVIVDDIAPEVSVKFEDTAEVCNGSYYSADRKAVITVKEANFWADDVMITVAERGNEISNANDEGYSEAVRVTPEFTPVEGTADTYFAEIDFDKDADYIFNMSYTDKSGNKADFVSNEGEDKKLFEEQKFTVDKIDPEIDIDFTDAVEPANENQFKADRIATITVKEHNFDPEGIFAEITAAYKCGNPVEISSKNYYETLKNIENWDNDGDVYTISLPFDIDGQYDVKLSYTDLAGRKIAEETVINEKFGVDKVKPLDISVEYKESALSEFVRAVTFNYFRLPVLVTLTSIDETSGVDYFTYFCDDTLIQNDDKNEDIPVENREPYVVEFENGTTKTYEKATASFYIDPQFKGQVSFTSTDRAANESDGFSDSDNIIIVDDIAPVIDVKYDKTTANGHYTERTATVTVKEANFFAEDVKVIINRRLDSESEFRVLDDFVPVFTEVEGKEYTYQTVINFNELDANAEYIFDIEYTDRSGNKAADYKPDEFTVDVTYPEITVSYDNNDVRNTDKFKADRTAEIVITEHNFVPADVNAVVTAKDINGKDVDVTDYAAYLKTADSWEHNGDVHTAKITFSAEADYTFEIGYTDQAGNKNQGVDYGTSVATNKFTVDKTIPTSAITVGDWTESKNGTKWDKFLDDVSFSLWENKTVNVKVESADELSGLDTVEHFRSAEVLTLAQVKASADWIKVENNKTEFTYDVKPDERFIVYVHIVDKAGNEKYLSSDGIIVDKTMPDIETVAPVVTVEPQVQPVNGIYSGDVKVDLTVSDPVKGTVYSGLKSITYEIYNNSVSVDEPTQEGTLFTYDVTAKKQADLVQKYEKAECITVDSDKNNSNNITIKITAVDNSDNITVKTRDIKIDTTAPVIDISYDNNSADSGKFFKSNRTATITVTERNFVAEDIKIDITNTDGKMPKISDWTKVRGTGNMDDTKWVATVKYAADGDYTFAVSYTDKAGLECKKISFAEGTVAAKVFTIDKTEPVIKVTYNNNNAVNGNYFTAERVATVVVNEHNFNADRVNFSITATDDGKVISDPKISGWTSDGDIRTCNIYFSAEAKYDFDISVTDKAGNASADYKQDTFFVDKNDPEIKITGVENNSANSGKVAPVVTFSDVNIDMSKVKVTLSGANRGAVSYRNGHSDIHNGRVYSFSNFAATKEVDDIYTLTATATDKSGRTTTKYITFSVNRFGSVYKLGDGLTKLINKYSKSAGDVVLTEINPNKLSNIKMTLFKNSQTIELKEGTDFRIESLGGNGKWYRYIYTIFKENFADDGVYSITVYSEDSAGNVAENTLDTKNTEINFGIDKTKPIINLNNIESNKTYPVDILKVNMSSSDNLSLEAVTVELDGAVYKKWNKKDLKALAETGTDLEFDIFGDSKDAHNIKVTAVDEAGNEQIAEVEDFYVTTNLWVRYYTNKALFFGSIGGVVLLLGAIVFIIVKKRKKDEK